MYICKDRCETVFVPCIYLFLLLVFDLRFALFLCYFHFLLLPFFFT